MNLINTSLRFGLITAFFACAAFAADDVAGAVEGTVKTVDKAGKTVVVKTADGTEQTVRYVGKKTAEGAKDTFDGVKEGDHVVVHYTEKGAVKTGTEVEHVSKDGWKSSVVAVKSVDKAAKTVTVKTAEGGEETYHLTEAAGRETGKGLEKTGKVTVHYTEEGGKKVVHFFSNN